MDELKHAKDTNSYMQLCLYQEGKGNIYLMIPTYYNADKKEWMGFVKTPKTGKMIYGTGKDSKELEQSFNKHLETFFEKNPEEALSMFKPLEYWEVKMNG